MVTVGVWPSANRHDGSETQADAARVATLMLMAVLALRAAVLRGGQCISVDGAALVVGDGVLPEAGDKVPADPRILQAHGLAAQEAMLTGESVPGYKTADAVPAEAALLSGGGHLG